MAVKSLEFTSREEWREFRKGKIGGSDASAVLGMNPYKSNVDLFYEKTGQLVPDDIDSKPYVQYGIKAEEHLRELFKLDHPELEVGYTENNAWINTKYPWAHASLDGWIIDKDGRRGILEIKTTEIMRSQQKEDWNHRIPQNYFTQVLHYMAVVEAEFALLKAQLKYKFDDGIYLQTKHFRIERDEVLQDMEYLMNEEKKFANCIKKRKKPDLILPEISGPSI